MKAKIFIEILLFSSISVFKKGTNSVHNFLNDDTMIVYLLGQKGKKLNYKGEKIN